MKRDPPLEFIPMLVNFEVMARNGDGWETLVVDVAWVPVYLVVMLVMQQYSR